MKIVIQYPPDYDGELHINAERVSNGIKYSFIYACKDNDNELEVLWEAARQITCYLNKGE